MLDPLNYDPLQIHAEVLLRCVKQDNVVAVIDDRLTGSRRFSAEYAQISRGNDGSVTIDGKWVTYRPYDIIVARRDRADRAKLRNLAQSLDKSGGRLSFDERATFAYSLPWEASAATYYNQYLNLLNPSSSYGSFSDPTMRTYGAMTDAERKMLQTGAPVSKYSSAVQQELYRYLLYRGGSSRYSERYGGQSGESAAESARYQELRNSGLYREITFLIGNGFSENATLSGGITGSITLELQNEAGSLIPTSYLSPRMVGDLLFKRTHPERYKAETQSYNFREDSVRVSKSNQLTLRLAVNSHTSFDLAFGEADYIDDRTYSISSLPSEIRGEIQRAYVQAEKNFSGGN